MDEHASKIANLARLFIGDEWLDVPGDASGDVVSRSAEGNSFWTGIGNAPVPRHFVAESSNRDRPEGRRHRDAFAACRTEMLCRLLEPIRPAAWGGRPVLWPLWANEMVHRTYVTIHLTELLISRLRGDADASMRFELNYRVASNLAAAIGELVIVHDNERLPCSAVLRGVARNFVELFGPVAGNIGIATRIEPLLLPAFKRRALVLVVVELISQSLVNPSRGPATGDIEVRLAPISRSRVRLTVRSGGSGYPDHVSQACPPIGNDLASLLEAEIIHGTPRPDGAVARIEFSA